MFMNSALVSLSVESTVAEAVDYWLTTKRTEVRPDTWKGYRQMSQYIVGPILAGSKVERNRLRALRKKVSSGRSASNVR